MAYLVRVALACLLAVCGVAHAYGIVPKVASFEATGGGIPSTFATTANGACATHLSAYVLWATSQSSSTNFAGSNGQASNPSGGACVAFITTTSRANGGVIFSGWTTFGNVVGGGQVCPEDSEASGQQCVCNSGFKPESGSCAAINCQAVKDQAAAQSFQWSGNSSSFCHKGCTLTAAVRGYMSSTNKSSAEGSSMFSDSSSCQGAQNGAGDGTDTGVTDQAARCGAGKCPGTVNGQSVCVPCSTTVKPTTTAASAPPGVTAELPGAPAGSTSKEVGVTSKDGTVTTTTTYRDAGGNITGETKEDKPELTFCAENPESPLCVKSSIDAQCGVGTCTGDAIQCAIAREQAKRACEFFAPTGATVDLGSEQTGAPRDSLHPGSPGNKETISFSGAIDQTDRLAGSCPADLAFSLNGRPMVLALSGLCSPLQMLGGLVVAFSMLAAVFIVFRN